MQAMSQPFDFEAMNDWIGSDETPDGGRKLHALRERFASVAYYKGLQETNDNDYFELWVLTKSIPGHPVESSVTTATLETYFYDLDTQTELNLFPKMRYPVTVKIYATLRRIFSWLGMRLFDVSHFCGDKESKALLRQINRRD